MSLLLVPHEATATTARIWLAGAGEELNGAELLVREAGTRIQLGEPAGSLWTSHSGRSRLDQRFIDLVALQPRRSYGLELRRNGASARGTVTTLPRAVPDLGQAPFRVLWAMGLAVLASCGCARVGRSLADGAAASARDKVPPIAQRLTDVVTVSVRDTLLNAHTRREVLGLVDSLMARLTVRSQAWRDSVVGTTAEQLGTRLRTDYLGDATLSRLALFRDDLLGPRTRTRVGALRDDLLGPATRALADSLAVQLLRHAGAEVGTALRRELQDPRTEEAGRRLLDGAVDQLGKSYEKSLRPIVHGHLDVAQRYAWQLLAGLAGLAAVIVVFVYSKVRKYRDLLGLVTYEIHSIPDREVYDELTQRIRKHAQRTGMEPALRRSLAQRGIG